MGIVRTVSPASRGLPRLLQQPSLSFPSSRLLEPLPVWFNFGWLLLSCGSLGGVMDPTDLGLSPGLAFLAMCPKTGHLTTPSPAPSLCFFSMWLALAPALRRAVLRLG